MSQMILTTSNMQMARANCIGELRRLDRILFPDGQKSLLDPSVSADEAEAAVKDFLEARFQQGTISGNLEKFVDTFSGGGFTLRMGETVRRQITAIASHEAELRRGINSLFEDEGRNGRKISSLLINVLISAIVSAGIAAITTEKALAATESATVSSGISSSSNAGGSSWWIAVLIGAVLCAGGVYLYKSNKQITSATRTYMENTELSRSSISKQDALEVLDLLVTIAAIYRVCEK